MASGFKKATVKSSRVPSTQSNFPVYIDLKRLNGGTSMTTAEANSIRVYANESKTTEWAREIVSVDEMHVKVPSMTSTTDIYVDWDGSRSDYGVTDTYGRNAVWSDYEAVLHLNDANSSTGSNNFTNTGSTPFGSAKIGNGAQFNRTDNRRIGVTSNNLNLNWSNSYTWSFWTNVNSFANAAYLFDHASNSGAQRRLIVYNNGGVSAFRFFWSGNEIASSTVSTSTWYKITAVKDGTTMRQYIGATALGTTTLSTVNYNFNQACIGTASDGFTVNSNATIDETRYRVGALSADWITTEYNNQNDEADFWGTWTDAGGSPAVAKGGILLAW
jgi:hypothetical protein